MIDVKCQSSMYESVLKSKVSEPSMNSQRSTASRSAKRFNIQHAMARVVSVTER